MKTYCLLACLFTTTTMFGMEESQSTLLAEGKAEKQQLLFDTIKRCKPTDEIDTAALRKLISEVDINYRYPRTPLAQAIYCGNLAVLREVLATPGLNATIPVSTFGNALHTAAYYPAALRLLIASKASLTPPLNLNQPGEDDVTPLYRACHWGNVESVRLLCAEPEVNPNDPFYRNTYPLPFERHYPLHAAVSAERDYEGLILRALADKGAIMESWNSQKETPYQLAFKQIVENPHSPYSKIIALAALGAQKVLCIIGNQKRSIQAEIDKFSVTSTTDRTTERDHK